MIWLRNYIIHKNNEELLYGHRKSRENIFENERESRTYHRYVGANNDDSHQNEQYRHKRHENSRYPADTLDTAENNQGNDDGYDDACNQNHNVRFNALHTLENIFKRTRYVIRLRAAHTDCGKNAEHRRHNAEYFPKAF